MGCRRRAGLGLTQTEQRTEAAGMPLDKIAEQEFLEGCALFEQRQYSDAHRIFSSLVRRYSTEGQFHFWLGWTLSQLGEKARAQEAMEMSAGLSSALPQNPYLIRDGYIPRSLLRFRFWDSRICQDADETSAAFRPLKTYRYSGACSGENHYRDLGGRLLFGCPAATVAGPRTGLGYRVPAAVYDCRGPRWTGPSWK